MFVQAAAELLEDGRLDLQLLRERVVPVQPEREPQLLQAAAVLLDALGLGGLELDAAELLLDVVTDVAQPLDVETDPLPLPLRRDLLGLGAADAVRLATDTAAVLR